MPRVLIATSTLAWGVNLPARRVVVLGVKRASDWVSPVDIKQMVGRAGRTGLDERGDAYVMLPEDEFDDLVRVYDNIPPIQSQLAVPDTLLFHTIAEMDSGSIRDAKSLLRWHARSLATLQKGALTQEQADEVFDLLARCRAIKEGPVGWTPTTLGRISAWLYFDPRNIWAWACNGRNASENQLWESDAMLAFVLGAIPEGTLRYVSAEMEGHVGNFVWALNADRAKVNAPSKTNFPGLVESWAYWAALQGAQTSGKDSIGGAAAMHVRTVRNDVERVVSALKLIDGMWGRWGQDDIWDTLALRIKHGVGRELVPLVRLPGIGPVRAKKLFEAGVRGPMDMIDPKHTRLIRVAVGANVADVAIAAAKRLVASGEIA